MGVYALGEIDLKMVAVTFKDATTSDFWATAEEVAKTECKVCVAVGMLVMKDDKIVKVALLSSKEKEGQARAFSNWIDIPASCVLAYEVIKTTREETSNV